MGGGPGQRPHVGIVPIPSLWRMEQDRVVGQQEIHLSSNGFFDHRLGGIDGEHHSLDDLVIPPKLPANWIPRFRQMQREEFSEPVFHISQSHGPRIRGLRLGLTTMIKRLCSLLAFGRCQDAQALANCFLIVPAAINLTLGCSFKAKLAGASGLMSLEA